MTPAPDHIRTFASVAELGSLSAAARALGLTQPTVGRHIGLLEEALHLTLFTRGRDGMALTEAGLRLVDSAAEMMRATQDFQRRAAGMDADMRGTVRITANEIFGVLILPGTLRGFAKAHPEIEIEIEVTNAASNLLRRDADVALRMFRPTQNDLVARRVTSLPLGIFAHESYLAEHPPLTVAEDLKTHRLIGFDRDSGIIDAMAKIGVSLDRSDFALRSDNILTHIAGIRSGLGIGPTHVGLAQQWPGVVQVLPDLPVPPLDLWIACHADVRYNRRVRLLVDHLAQALRTPYAFVP